MTTPDDPLGPGPRASVDAATLAKLTGAKTVSNIAMRWLPVFLPTLERAFGATTTQLTSVLGVGEFAGLSTVFVGRHLDRRRERTVMIIALGLVAVSALVALRGTVASFAVSYFVLVLGVANLTVAGQAWISHRIDYRWRARSIGLYETSWAVALLVGAPLIAVLINTFGWRGPFVAVAIAAVSAAVVVAFTLPSGRRVAATSDMTERVAGHVRPLPLDRPALERPARLSTRAWLVMLGSASTAMAGISVFVISGSWLDDAFGVSTGGIGVVAMTFGATEMVSSLGSAAIADRVGKLRSTLCGLAVMVAGLGIMVVADDRLWMGIAGILTFLLGYEFAFVTSLSLVSEAMPDARGSTLAMGNAVGTIARVGGAVAGGWLYGSHGINGTAALAVGAAVGALAALLLSRRPSRRPSVRPSVHPS